MSLGRQITLNTGAKMPQIGLGTWQSQQGEVARAVKVALDVGYRHIDAALIYGNQEEVGAGIKASGVKREDIFLTSKLWNNAHRVELIEKDLDRTLQELGTDYLDLYLIHWPVAFKPGQDLSPKTESGDEVLIDEQGASNVEIWRELIRLWKEGKKVKAIGVSNFPVKLMQQLIDETGVAPAVNQIEAHPGLQQGDLEAFAKQHNIHLTAYSPLGNNITGRARAIDSPQVQEMAERTDRDPAQILIAWVAHKGYSVIPKSVTPSRIESNFNDVLLLEQEFEEIARIGRENPIRYNTPILYKPKWDINVFDSPEEQGAKYQLN